MAFPANLSERAVEAMREVAREIILPRFQHLATGEVEEKSTGELLTIADKESERVLTMRLKDILPGSTVIGEELAEAHPEVVDNVGKGTVWLVDPLDGTSNFVAGRPLLSVMVSLVVDGVAQLGLMLNPVAGVLHHAELGAGALRDGQRFAGSYRRAAADGTAWRHSQSFAAAGPEGGSFPVGGFPEGQPARLRLCGCRVSGDCRE